MESIGLRLGENTFTDRCIHCLFSFKWDSIVIYRKSICSRHVRRCAFERNHFKSKISITYMFVLHSACEANIW